MHNSLEQCLEKFKDKDSHQCLQLIYEWVKKDIIGFSVFKSLIETQKSKLSHEISEDDW